METLLLVTGTVVAWFAVEFYLIWKKQPTISDEIIKLYRQFPTLGLLVGLIFGLLFGHWFWMI
jgi:hypothetical protein